MWFRIWINFSNGGPKWQYSSKEDVQFNILILDILLSTMIAPSFFYSSLEIFT